MVTGLLVSEQRAQGGRREVRRSLWLLAGNAETPPPLDAGFCVNHLDRGFRGKLSGSPGRTRTCNQPVNSRLLYH